MGLFDLRPKNKRIANAIRIALLKNFRHSINMLRRDGLSLKEYQGLVLAQNRARATAVRARISAGERLDMLEVASIRLPKPLNPTIIVFCYYTVVGKHYIL